MIKNPFSHLKSNLELQYRWQETAYTYAMWPIQ